MTNTNNHNINNNNNNKNTLKTKDDKHFIYKCI